jgi:2-polyprenyl-6-methoxyphenol hydroxylase-like FAD-dependent oxidoreductase
MTAVKTVLIAGGGVGGLTAAVALCKQGIKVELLEKNPEHSVYGVGIIQPNNALRALDTIGLAEECVKRGGAFDAVRVFDRFGTLIGGGSSSADAAPHLPPINGITRPILQEILLTAAQKAGAVIRVGVTIKEWSEKDGKVSVTSSDGATRDYDFLIGADGVSSQLRKDLFPDAPSPVFSGQSGWRYNLARPSELACGELWYGEKSKVGLVPLSPTLMYIFICTHEPGNPFMQVDGLAGKMRHRLAEYGGRVARLREQIVDDRAVVYKALDHLMLPAPWYKGRVLVIGDAAHATTPHLAQGAAMAIEDAVLLGELLARDAPVPDLLEEFMRRRFARSKLVVETSTQLVNWELATWEGPDNFNHQAGVASAMAQTELMKSY